MIEGTLIALAALAAVANLIFGSVLAWGLSGGDGEGSV
jgi:ABC-type sulfate transport system permease component